MQTFLIASKDIPFIKSEIKKITVDLKVSSVNLIEITPLTSIGIADVKKISKIIMLKPYGGGKRVIIIQNIEKATLEASNALLKILEEPPPDNFIILVTANINKLLPTITSRCQIISDNAQPEYESFNTAEVKILIRQILNSSPGERILFSQQYAKSREEALNLLSNLTLILEELLYKKDDEINLSYKDIAALITRIIKAKNYVERYINFRATLDILFLGFPKTS